MHEIKHKFMTHITSSRGSKSPLVCRTLRGRSRRTSPGRSFPGSRPSPQAACVPTRCASLCPTTCSTTTTSAFTGAGCSRSTVRFTLVTCLYYTLSLSTCLHSILTIFRRDQRLLAQAAVGAPWTSSSLNIRRDLHWLPVGHCHTHTQRLKSSGVKAGKSATVTDGVLVIDGVC